jgi:HK97 family phage major capsid protein/HK97 family phage prohead protease
MTKLELRQIDVELSGAKEESGDLVVSGYVNQTGQWSQPLGREKRFVEKIEPGTFKRAIDKGNDIHFLAEHDNKLLLASTKNDSLILREDDKGLYMEARISPTSWGKDYHQLITDGLLTSMSFGMGVSADRWEKRSDGLYERSISDLTLAEVSVVRNPAYVQSSIQARSIELIDEPNITLTEEPTMNKEKQLAELRAQMEALEVEVRAENASAVEVRGEVESAEAVELRGVEMYLKGNVLADEVRTMTTTTGALAVPKQLSQTIIEKLVEQAPLFGRAKSFQPVSGTLEILRENTINSAAFVGEMENVTAADFTFDKVVLEQRRAGTAIELTQQLVNDSGINVVDYAVNVMTKRLAREMDRSVLVGDKNNKQFEGILTTTAAGTVAASVTGGAANIKIDDLLTAQLAMHPDLIDGSVWVVSRPTFNAIAKLKDLQGNYYLNRDVVNGRSAYRVLGNEIIIQDNMPAAATGAIIVAFINFSESYATMIKKGAQFKRITDDTTQALRGSQLLILDIFADGKIINEAGIKFIKQA